MSTWAGYYLNLDYSAKLFVLTFILVVLGSDHASGTALCCVGFEYLRSQTAAVAARSPEESYTFGLPSMPTLT